MDRNLGASQVATSSTDADSYGDLYQWGRGKDGHQCSHLGTTSTLSTTDIPGHGDFILNSSSPYDWRNPKNDSLWQGVNGINNPCPNGYRVPTQAELNDERLSWSSNNAAGAFGSVLKLPLAGRLDGHVGTTKSFGWVGNKGFYISSTVQGNNIKGLEFNSTSAFIWDYFRVGAYSVRCIKD